MPFSPPRLSDRSLSNEKGQMAIFVALTFQILFVFFAMVVNVGLIVHDKINLQNAVDLAAYYGAQKQGELLNEIAHINYQIRQDFKLMTWRMRVLGEFGRTAHPGSQASIGATIVPSDATEYKYADSTAVCVTHPGWVEDPTNQTLCRDPYIHIPQIPHFDVIAPFNAFNYGFQASIDNLRNLFAAGCRDQGQLNWYFAAMFFSAYKRGVSTRKQMIQQIAANLSSAVGDFKDRQMQSVRAGMLATLKNNLTASNLASLQDSDVFALNSMGLGSCNDPSYWLPDIPIRPYLMYTDNDQIGGGCNASPQVIFVGPSSRNIMPKLDPDGSLLNLTSNSDSVAVSNPLHSSMGFEKNPWCVAYYGVRATTRPRKPFAPFGGATALEARSYAEPFGGRIGPWYGSVWNKGDGGSSGARTDPLTPPRLPLAAPLSDADLKAQSMPNYSRYPGDPLGLKSMAGIGSMRSALWTFFTPGQQLSLKSYEGLKDVPTYGDVLPWDLDNNKPVPVRTLEQAAVAPDLFDITYYSVDADYPHVYFTASQGGRFSGIKPISDIGTRFDPAATMNNNVATQVTAANTAGIVDPAISFWTVRAAGNLLTGWTQNGAADYSFPTGRFGSCLTTPTPAAPTVGGCAVGGRVGYSVRHVARAYLTFPGLALGGAGSAGPMDNPPTAAGDGW